MHITWAAMYRMRETMTSRMGPLSAPSRWISSMTSRPTCGTTLPVQLQYIAIPSGNMCSADRSKRAGGGNGNGALNARMIE
jgi:hypothetical protein